jgi:hypothetical protein
MKFGLAFLIILFLWISIFIGFNMDSNEGKVFLENGIINPFARDYSYGWPFYFIKIRKFENGSSIVDIYYAAIAANVLLFSCSTAFLYRVVPKPVST